LGDGEAKADAQIHQVRTVQDQGAAMTTFGEAKNMNAQHAPWRIGNGDGGKPRQTDELVHIFGAEDRRIAQWVRAEVAPIIVAAPDMLAALKALYEALCSDPPDGGPQKHVAADGVIYRLDGEAMYQAINAVRTAIAKAAAPSITDLLAKEQP
jgi:hypothetical protein